jgi:DNA-binding transcriptional MerR regulator
MTPFHLPLVPIGLVERETGLSRATLRRWEASYGYPLPVRAANGDRMYRAQDLPRLQLIKRLLERQLRPGAVVGLSLAELMALEVSHPAPLVDANEEASHAWVIQALNNIRSPDTSRLKSTLAQALQDQGLQVFVVTTLRALNNAVGAAWSAGLVSVFQEHFYTATMVSFLQEVLQGLEPQPNRPSILLTTPPGEAHYLGLLSLQVLLAQVGCRCIALGTQTPVAEIAAAAKYYAADVVALSFSVSFPVRQVRPFLHDLAQHLQCPTRIWAGGAGVQRLKDLPDGVQTFTNMQAVQTACVDFSPRFL